MQIDIPSKGSLTNGELENYRKDPRLVGFILAALSHGFKVSLLYGTCIQCRYSSKVEISCNAQGSGKIIWATHRDHKGVMFEMPFGWFAWDDIEVGGGDLRYKDEFICHTSKKTPLALLEMNPYYREHSKF